MSPTKSQTRTLLSLLHVACESIGVQRHQIEFEAPGKFTLADFGLEVQFDDNGSTPLWIIRETYKTISLSTSEGRNVEKIVASIPVADYTTVAQQIATRVAQQLIELALDGELTGA